MLHRKGYQRLLTWKEQEQGQSALRIEGARRVGKSTLVEQFAQREYRSYILIDFSTISDEVKDIFRNQRTDLERFFTYLSVYFNTPLHQRDSLIIFDEVQYFPTARAFIKQLVADGRYDYIETGSLISIRQNIDGILIPSEEDAFRLNPLDFEEFLWALGEEPLASAIQDSFHELQPLPAAIHRKASQLLREYMLVGGMPKPVADYAATHDFAQVDRSKRRILDLYRNDVARFARGYEAKVTSVFDRIPEQLSKHEKRFNLASLSKDARMRDYDEAFFWLSDACITNNCYRAADPHVGLRMEEDRATLKCYMADTGLLVSQAFPAGRGENAANEIYREILFGQLNVNEGMLAENLVAQQLRAAGYDLFFYSSNNRSKAEQTMEIDFLLPAPYAQAKAKLRVSPVEVKSTSRYGSKSLDKFKARFAKRVGTQYVIHPKELSQAGDRVYLPLYMAHCL
ncbi:ATP-binding protein [Bombiscardovia apis]|uniref:ATP-binding protein n=1 Tax=Bombiscardovia apis TaxID=2932182 RepID=UPI0029535931|nr:AAA family ATPase [Bombiscardovia apis]